MKLKWVTLRLGRADGLEELFEDGVESSDFPLGGLKVVCEALLILLWQFFELSP